MIVNIQRGKERYFFESSKIESIRLYSDDLQNATKTEIKDNVETTTYTTSIVNVIEVTTTGRIHFITYDENETECYKRDWQTLLAAIEKL